MEAEPVSSRIPCVKLPFPAKLCRDSPVSGPDFSSVLHEVDGEKNFRQTCL